MTRTVLDNGGKMGASLPDQIWRLDKPGPGDASHAYGLMKTGPDYDDGPLAVVMLQNGPRREVGSNGFLDEDLLAIVKDRLEAFQRGPFAHDQNGVAIGHIDLAIQALDGRTRGRTARGVEGLSEA
jgi:hypothetical protein